MNNGTRHRKEQPNDYASPEEQKKGYSRYYWDRRFTMSDTDEYPTLQVPIIVRKRKKTSKIDVVVVICLIILTWLFIFLLIASCIAFSISVASGG